MEIRNDTWKQRHAFILENEHLRVIVLPELGGKAASIFDKTSNLELAAQPNRPYKLPVQNSDFSQYDASGFDDAYPCIHACSYSGYEYPDHGEIWVSPMDADVRNDGLVLTFQSSRFPYKYEKRITLTKNAMHLEYCIDNTGTEPFPSLWAFHGLLRYEKDMKIIYPPGITEFINTLDSPELGFAGSIHSIDGEYDFSKPPEPTSMVKYYANGRVKEGTCGVYYPSYDRFCTLRYDSSVMPYLGVWITVGGFRGDFNCALEPCNGFYDDIVTAKENDSLFMLEKTLRFNLSLEISKNI